MADGQVKLASGRATLGRRPNRFFAREERIDHRFSLTVRTRGDTPNHESHDRFPLRLPLLPRGEKGVS